MPHEGTMIYKKNRILVVDDDIHILQMIQRILEKEGYGVSTAESGESALSMFVEINPSLVLLELLLPGMEGIEVCRCIRQFSKIPILIVTAKGTIDLTVKGLNLGADDYITKPFSEQELVARIAAAIHRVNFQNNPIQDMVIKCRGGLKIDLANKLVTMRNEIIDLSSTEYRILAFLAMNGNRVVSSRKILVAIWGNAPQNNAHILQVNIGRLRDKLKDDERGNRYIETKIGIGYYLNCKEFKR
jgi:DNA-binding response OmpR family regulator